MLVDMRLDGRSSLFTDKDSLHVIYILSQRIWTVYRLVRVGMASAACRCRCGRGVTALSVVLLAVSALAVSSQVATTLNGVVVPDVALGAVALLPLEPSVRALAAANHGVTPSGVGRDDYLAKWSVSVLMILNETLASAITKADIYQY